MSWLKQSDVAAMHPVVLAALDPEDADDRILNELYGFVNRCATQSAAHDKDYIVTVGTARAMAGSAERFKALVHEAVRCGYFVRVTLPDPTTGKDVSAYKLIQDPDLFHMILKDEKEWERQQRKDTGDAALAGPARARDGDACRWCGRVVVWGADRKSVRAGTLDHLRPGAPATVATLLVACKGCNSARRDDPTAINGGQPRPAPPEPLIGPATAQYLTIKCGIPTKPTYTSLADLATTDPLPEPEATVTTGPDATGPTPPGEATVPAEHGTTVPTGAPDSPCTGRPDLGAATVPGSSPADGSPEPGTPTRRASVDTSEQISDRRSAGSRSTGSGRDGTGQVVPGRAGPGARSQPPSKRKRRSRPGRNQRKDR